MPDQSQTVPRTTPRWPTGTGEMARRIRAHDWTRTPLGPVEGWPQALKAAVGLMLHAASPMAVAWGADSVVLYNDRWRELIGDGHPRALGRPAREVFARVLAGAGAAEARDRLLPLDRRGRVEDARFGFGVNPIPLDDGSVGGLLAVAAETTARAAAERAARRLFDASPTPSIVLAPDPPRFTVTDVNDAYLAATMTTREGLVGRGIFEAFPDDPDDPHATGVGNLRASLERALSSKRPGAMARQKYAVARPGGGFEERWWDVVNAPMLDEAGEVAAVIHHAVDATEQERTERALRESEGLRRIALEGGRMGAWRWDRRTRLIRGDAAFLALWGVAPSDDPYPVEVFTGRMSPDGRATMEAVMAQDIAPGEEFDGQMEIAAGPSAGRWVRWRGRAGRETPWVLDGVSFDVTGQRLADERLRESEERRAFLLDFSDTLRPLADPDAIQGEACRLLAGRLDADRAYYVEVDEAAGIARVGRDFVRGDAVSIAGEHRVADFGWSVAILRGGECHVVGDTQTSGLVPPADRPACAALRIIACMGAPLIKGGRLVGALCVTASRPRAWTPGEVGLLREVGERIWAAVERARAEAALRESEARFRALAEAIEDVFYMTDLDRGALLYLSPSYERVWGRPASALLADLSGFEATLHPDDRPALEAAKAAQARGEPVAAEYRVLRPDGAVRWVHDRSFPVPGGPGRRAAGIAADVTARKVAEAALRESEVRFRQFAEASSDLLWIRDADTLRFEYLGPAFEAIYGRSREAVLSGDNVESWAELIHPDDRGFALDNLGRLRAGERVAEEFRVVRPSDGAVRWVHNTDFPLPDDAGRVRRIAGIASDVTGRKEAAERMGVLVAELQHRTRNLLAVVRSVADKTLAGSASVDDFRGRFGARLAALARVNGLLSRLNEGDRIAFDELIRTELSGRGAMDENGRGPRVTLDGPRGVRLRSSTVQTFALALHELATNAVKHGALSRPEGRLHVAWRVVEGEGGERRLRVDWEESGVPVSPPPDGQTRRHGYGRELIERALPYQLKAEIRYELGSDGVRCTITLPVSAQGAAERAPRGAAGGTKRA